jgi:hypothetical protein
VRSDGFLAQMVVKVSLKVVESNLSSNAGWSKIDMLQITCDGGEQSTPSNVLVELLIHLLKSC